MKRMIPFLMLAFGLAACQDEGPTVPTDGPELAKGGNKCETPPCGKDGGGNGGGEYTATSLGKWKIASKARDLSWPQAGEALLVVGESEDASGNLVATAWSEGTEGWEEVQLPLDGGFSESSAYGTNDLGNVIVGTFGDPWVDSKPAKWSRSDTEWTSDVLDPVSGYRVGEAFDVNDAGTVAGTSIGPDDSSLPFTVATVWGADLDWTPLPSVFEGGTGRAFAISSAGYVAGGSRTENPNSPPWHATLWRPPYGDTDVCDLHLLLGLAPDGKTIARGITDLPDGSVLVAVESLLLEVAWAPGALCTIAHAYPDLAEAGQAFDVAVVAGEIQAVAKKGDRPARWLVESGVGTTLADNRGYALGINDAGWIVGWTSVKGKERAWLWIPTP